MSNEVSIFKADLPAAQRSTGVSALTASLTTGDYKSRRISIKGRSEEHTSELQSH